MLNSSLPSLTPRPCSELCIFKYFWLALLPHVSNIPSWLPHVQALASNPLLQSALLFQGHSGARRLPFQLNLQLITHLRKKKKSFRGKFIAEIPIFLEMFSIFFLNSTRSIYQSELEAHTSHRYTHQRIFTEFQCLGEAVFSPKDLRGGKLTWLVKLIHG